MIFFNSSMPRSGSTLMQNILGNNPNIYATPTSGLVELLLTSKKEYTSSICFKAQDELEMKKGFLHYCRFGMEGYFYSLSNKPNAIDKSRRWMINYSFLNEVYPNAKVICMVRDMRDIIASMEKNFRRFPYKFDKQDNSTMRNRVEHWLNNIPVGTMYKDIRESINRGYSDKILYIKFETLCKKPDEVMKVVYDYLELPYYQHNFDDIKQVTFENDRLHGRYGDHIIQNKIRPVASKAKELLGQQLCDYIYENTKWYSEYFKYKY